MLAYLFFVFFDTAITKDKLYVIVAANDCVQAVLKAEELMCDGISMPAISITGVQKLI